MAFVFSVSFLQSLLIDKQTIIVIINLRHTNVAVHLIIE